MGFDLSGQLILVNLGGLCCGNCTCPCLRFKCTHHHGRCTCQVLLCTLLNSDHSKFSLLFPFWTILPLSPKLPAVPWTTCSIDASGIFCSPCSGILRGIFFFKKIWFLPLGNRNYPLCTWKTNELQGEQGLHGTEKCQNPPQMKSPAQKEARCFEEGLEKKKKKRKPTPE